MAQRRVGEQRVDGGQAVVAGPDAVATLDFDMVDEGADQYGVEVLEVELGGRLAGVTLRVAEQEPERVPIGSDGVWAGREAGR